MANPRASPILHHQSHLSLFHFRTRHSFSSLHFNKPLLFLPYSSSFSSSFPSQSEQQCNHQVRRVSTVPVEYSTPTPPESDDFLLEIDRLKALRLKLDVSKDIRRKEAVIDADSRVRRFFSENRGGLSSKVLGSIGLNSKEMFLVKCVIAAGQEHALCVGYEEAFEEEEEEEEEYTVRSSVKSALYALVEMIERFDVNSSGYKGRRETSTVLGAEESAHFRKFLTFLEEIEQFYDCIGGIIGYRF